MRIYLDHNSGSTLRPEAIAALNALLLEGEGNPAAVHRAGQRARRALEQARSEVAALVAASPSEIIFTSGGTESNNFAIAGALGALSTRRKVITSAIEHSSILAPLVNLENRGFEVVRIAPDPEGRISPEAIAGAIDETTALVTLGLANGEVGTIQDLGEIARRAASAGALFHLDAAQAAGRIPLEVDALGCALMTLSAHKLGAPAGSGALFIRDDCQVAPMLLGGPQENARRAGTPNLLGAVAFGAAAQAAVRALPLEAARLGALTQSLFSLLAAQIPGLVCNGPPKDRIPNTLNLTFPGVLGESMLIALDLEGIQVSMGSACAAGAVEPSHVLLAMGRSAREARSSLRLSLGWNTTAQEVARAAETIIRVWRRVSESEPAAAREALS
ncbi:MAG TPA: cysteine desulfurase family protein [Candidatus Binataceae bacterium]|nr:cysteine desulfurase family protein [Candidatus Binataceae bacterium]